MIIIIIDYSSLFLLYFILIPSATLIWSLFKAIILSDIKSIIALSTISQISYMFLAVLASPILTLYHIIIHSLFKSLLFLLAGSLIHNVANNQNIYRIKIKCKFYLVLYSLCAYILILSYQKELIIHDISLYCSSYYLWLVIIIGAICTTLYTLKIYLHCFWIYELIILLY